MIAGVIQTVKSEEEAKALLARWSRFGNFLTAYTVPPRPGGQDLRYVGVFSYSKELNPSLHVPSVRHGDDRATA